MRVSLVTYRVNTLMKIGLKLAFLVLLLGSLPAAAQTTSGTKDDYLSWSAGQAEQIGKQMRENGKTGGVFSFRGIHTDHAVNYKLRATLMTPEVIRATARLAQLTNRLTDDQTRAMVKEAEEAGDLIVMIEIDPNEGSGVIPLDWRAFLQPKALPAGAEGAITAIKMPELRRVKALAGVARRDYDYDVFWVSFPLLDANKKAAISPDLAEIQLIVGIYQSEGKISWRMPASVRDKIRSLSGNQ